MAQIQTLKDRGTGKTVYPVTTSKAVFDDNGVDLDTLLEKQKQSTENALKEYAKRTEVTQDLNAKQDKLSTTTDLHITDDNTIGLTNAAKVKLFDDMWEETGGTVIKSGVTYGRNGIDDIGYQEAIRMYVAYVSGNVPLKCRTNIPVGMRYYTEPAANPSAFSTTSIEILAGKFSSADARIYNSHALREIKYLRVGDSINNIYIESRSLEIIYFDAQNADAKLFGTFNIKNASKFRIDGIDEIIRWVRDSIITVHADVYAKLTGDTTNEAAAALTAEELAQWQQVCLDANARNIAFATA